jgi:hypothetical protein
VLTRVRFREKDRRVLPEMSAKVAFLPERKGNEQADTLARLTIPSTALATRNGREVVFRVSEEKLTETPVRTGERIGARIVILDGLTTADRIVLRPSEDLTDGTRVKVL